MELRLARREESSLNKDLRECQLQNARLKKEISNAAVQYEKTLGFIGKKSGQIGVSWLAVFYAYFDINAVAEGLYPPSAHRHTSRRCKSVIIAFVVGAPETLRSCWLAQSTMLTRLAQFLLNSGRQVISIFLHIIRGRLITISA